jgi:hypothetical protein
VRKTTTSTKNDQRIFGEGIDNLDRRQKKNKEDKYQDLNDKRDSIYWQSLGFSQDYTVVQTAIFEMMYLDGKFKVI